MFKDTVIKYLNTLANSNKKYLGKYKHYYGYDSNDTIRTYDSDLSEFINNPVVLTLEEFIELSKKEEMYELY